MCYLVVAQHRSHNFCAELVGGCPEGAAALIATVAGNVVSSLVRVQSYLQTVEYRI